MKRELKTSSAKVTYIGAWDTTLSESARYAASAVLTATNERSTLAEIDNETQAAINDVLESLDPESRKQVENILREIDRGNLDIAETYRDIFEADYEDGPPVTIQQFLEDDYYIGPMVTELFPLWRRDLYNVFAPGAQYAEWLMGGAIGAGKSFVAAIGMTYLVYKMTCLRDPQSYYQLAAKVGRITFGIYSVTQSQAHDVAYDYVRSFVENTPYFKERSPINTKLFKRIDFINKPVRVIVGSRAFHTLGQNLFGLMQDETNFMQETSKKAKQKAGDATPTDQATQIYNSAAARLMSRFMRPGGSVPGMMFLVSSKQHQHSFLETRMKQAREQGLIERKRVYVSEYANWAVRPREKYSAPCFYVEVGDRLFPSRILRSQTAENAIAEARPGSTVQEVPGELRDTFVRDLDRALRDMAGIATFGVAPFFRDGAKLRNCITTDWQHPFTRDDIMISTLDRVQIMDYFLSDRMFRIAKSRYVPLINPHMPRAIHFDIAITNDSFGMAMGHIAGRKVILHTRENGEIYSESVPIVFIDFVLRIVPPDRGEIPIDRATAFVQALRQMGMPIKWVTSDEFQSRASLQTLAQAGFDTKVLSMDRTTVPYEWLRAAVYEDRCRYYAHPTLMRELDRLERDIDLNKIDHPAMFDEHTRGSKDVADSVCGVVYTCLDRPEMWVGAPETEASLVNVQAVVPHNPMIVLSRKAVNDARNKIRKGRI